MKNIEYLHLIRWENDPKICQCRSVEVKWNAISTQNNIKELCKLVYIPRAWKIRYYISKRKDGLLGQANLRNCLVDVIAYHSKILLEIFFKWQKKWELISSETGSYLGKGTFCLDVFNSAIPGLLLCGTFLPSNALFPHRVWNTAIISSITGTWRRLYIIGTIMLMCAHWSMNIL